MIWDWGFWMSDLGMPRYRIWEFRFRILDFKNDEILAIVVASLRTAKLRKRNS